MDESQTWKDYPQLLPMSKAHPNGNIPTLYSDGVSSAQIGREVVRFYISRFDPNLSGSSPAQNEPVAQIIMSASAFVQAVAFLNKMVDGMVSTGIVTSEEKSRLYNFEAPV